jgi:tryptophan synthase alpha subunit
MHGFKHHAENVTKQDEPLPDRFAKQMGNSRTDFLRSPIAIRLGISMPQPSRTFTQTAETLIVGSR